jgi:hypothetical protein
LNARLVITLMGKIVGRQIEQVGQGCLNKVTGL